MPIEEIALALLPGGLRHIPQPPAKLWLRGKLPSPHHKLLAVVGSRALTHYGREACESLISGLAGYPVSVVSGLALGADACAHRAALNAGLHTIAIPGSGLDDSVLGPKTNLGLASQILAASGALLSEHEPTYEAHPYDFPSRNRIMVGLADAVLMIEAGNRSGTLITARLATEYNRQLLCVPHRIGDVHSFGSHLFLRLGAAVAAEPEHILEALGIEPRVSATEEEVLVTLSAEEASLYKLLETPQSRDELLRTCDMPAHVALSMLGMLELRGIIVEEFGLWRRSS